MNVRPATVADVPAMVDLINGFAERGVMLHRSRAEMYERVKDFHIAEDGGELLGLSGLRVMWSNLAEVYGLAVSSNAHGKGVGRGLVEATVEMARELAIHRVFALTYERAFFERCGFIVADRRTLPLKVWGECIRCPKHEACDEIAVVRVLDGVPDLGEPVVMDVEQAKEAGVPIPTVTEATLRIDRGAE